MFFAETQNKLLYAVIKKTAAEIVLDRANDNEPNMGLTSWKGAIVRKQDITVAKNYLSHDEIDSLNRLIVIFLESAELRAKENKDLRVDFWRNNVDSLLQFSGKEILKGTGSISNAVMEKRVTMVFDEFDIKRKKIEAELADKEDLLFLEDAEKVIKNRNK